MIATLLLCEESECMPQLIISFSVTLNEIFALIKITRNFGMFGLYVSVWTYYMCSAVVLRYNHRLHPASKSTLISLTRGEIAAILICNSVINKHFVNGILAIFHKIAWQRSCLTSQVISQHWVKKRSRQIRKYWDQCWLNYGSAYRWISARQQ